jgi:hypothetical protein
MGGLPTMLVLGIAGPSTTPYVAVMLLGLAIGILGHLSKTNVLIALGIGMILVALVIFQFHVRSFGGG